MPSSVSFNHCFFSLIFSFIKTILKTVLYQVELVLTIATSVCYQLLQMVFYLSKSHLDPDYTK